MAVFVDLDDDDCASSGRSCDDAGSTRLPTPISASHDQLKPVIERASSPVDASNTVKSVRVDAMKVNRVAAALTCYPIALSLASHLDLNDLHALAATCRSVHTSLTQYAPQLKAHSLRCVHDETPVLAEALAMTEREEPRMEVSLYGDALTTASAAWQPHAQMEDAMRPFAGSAPEGLYSSVGATSKISSCARDLVAPCRRCGTVVCRNCAAKSPSNARLKDRHRRLCNTCLDAPLEAHLRPLVLPTESTDGVLVSSASSVKSERSYSDHSTSSSGSGIEDRERRQEYPRTFTSAAFLRGPCTCESRGVFLCVPCGQNLGSADTTYKRVWTWRSRYSTHIGGGLGTGLGVGNQGQKCGRGKDCLATGGKAVCWLEIDCTEGHSHDFHRVTDGSELSRMSTPDYTSNKPGYFQQEVEGIGGIVKKKAKKRVKVGATVWEYEDERESGKYLEREAKGAVRSWCGWCGRVCLGQKDRENPCLNLDSIVT
ncbi:hypothetical protein A1O1_00827 [Capronia coronata CBS 617.96]|uniref:Uncharacterized protein n=1 Tax=Capronia coronata CBS 617.96 TaxID=1182541 RepID=W9ZMH3_9EURO|nr:uncharacterized protein A1O1_00827 [Capronia coronata CBS 617.96]EXJ95704.1 hypothetical protein A1O1_00827 [Capronia coronata CBS 617.96]